MHSVNFWQWKITFDQLRFAKSFPVRVKCGQLCACICFIWWDWSNRYIGKVNIMMQKCNQPIKSIQEQNCCTKTLLIVVYGRNIVYIFFSAWLTVYLDKSIIEIIQLFCCCWIFLSMIVTIHIKDTTFYSFTYSF